MSKVKSDDRFRNFATIVYEDSAPSNWREIIQEELIPCFISPYHDKDINPTGEPKKPHYHVMLMFEGKKSEKQVKEIIAKFNGVGLKIVSSIRGMARYLCHLDNPEKAEYPIDKVIALCGCDYLSTIGLPFDKYKVINEMLHYIKINNIQYYSDLIDHARMYEFAWYKVLCDCGSYVVCQYIRDNFMRNRKIPIVKEKSECDSKDE